MKAVKDRLAALQMCEWAPLNTLRVANVENVVPAPLLRGALSSWALHMGVLHGLGLPREGISCRPRQIGCRVRDGGCEVPPYPHYITNTEAHSSFGGGEGGMVSSSFTPPSLVDRFCCPFSSFLYPEGKSRTRRGGMCGFCPFRGMSCQVVIVHCRCCHVDHHIRIHRGGKNPY